MYLHISYTLFATGTLSFLSLNKPCKDKKFPIVSDFFIFKFSGRLLEISSNFQLVSVL